MNNHLQTWIAELLKCLRSFPDGGNADAIEEQWRKHEDYKQPVVTIYGLWNVGKSSLLKRLIVDDGKPVPTWLTVKAEPTAFKVDEVSVPILGCIFRDTPGIGGNADHSSRAKEAVALSDAYLLVLPPQLIGATSQEDIIPLLTGKLFYSHLDTSFLPGSLLLVISRMDEGAGIDPADDLAAYKERVERKQNELKRILDRNKVSEELVDIHTVAADPYGAVGNQANPARADYDGYREWDGIAPLAEALKRLPSLLPHLRQKTAVRYFSLKGAEQLQLLNDQKLLQENALKECDNWIEKFSLLEKELDALINKAQVDLKKQVEDQLRSISAIGHTEQDKIVTTLEPRLQEVYKQWTTRQNSELQKLAERAKTELAAMALRPAAQNLSDIFPVNQENISEGLKLPPQGSIAILASTLELATTARRGSWDEKWKKTFQELKPEMVKKELDNFKTGGNNIEQYKAAGGQLSQEQIDQAPNLLKEEDNLTQFAAFAPLGGFAVEVGLFFWSEYQKEAAKKAILDRQAEMRQKLSGAANWIADGYFDNWKKSAESFRTQLEKSRQHYIQKKHLITEEMNQIIQLEEDMKQILSQPPV